MVAPAGIRLHDYRPLSWSRIFWCLLAGWPPRPARAQGWAVPAETGQAAGLNPRTQPLVPPAPRSWASPNLTVPGHLAEALPSHLSVFPSFPPEMSSLSNIKREGDSRKGGENSLDSVH